MPIGPEDIAREQIDRMLELSGWAVQDAKAVNLYAKQGVAIREFELKSGYGTADYLLYVDGRMEYGHEQAVADGVNVNYDVYRIKTAITEGGGKVEAGFYVDKRDRETRQIRWERLDEDLAYDPDQLDLQGLGAGPEHGPALRHEPDAP